jgi:hypothetical protein
LDEAQQIAAPASRDFPLAGILRVLITLKVAPARMRC